MSTLLSTLLIPTFMLRNIIQAGEANGCEVHGLDQSGELTEALIMSL